MTAGCIQSLFTVRNSIHSCVRAFQSNNRKYLQHLKCHSFSPFYYTVSLQTLGLRLICMLMAFSMSHNENRKHVTQKKKNNTNLTDVLSFYCFPIIEEKLSEQLLTLRWDGRYHHSTFMQSNCKQGAEKQLPWFSLSGYEIPWIKERKQPRNIH